MLVTEEEIYVRSNRFPNLTGEGYRLPIGIRDMHIRPKEYLEHPVTFGCILQIFRPFIIVVNIPRGRVVQRVFICRRVIVLYNRRPPRP